MADLQDRWADLPRIKADNAYELLDGICGIITEEPKRYNQQIWLDSLRRWHGVAEMRLLGGRLESAEYIPACGTIGCVAGWTDTLARNPTFYTSSADRARWILGLNPVQANELFSEWNVPADLRPQTPEHAAAGVAHIRAFMAKYEAQLKAQPVTLKDECRAN